MSSAQSHRMKFSGTGWYLASMMQSTRVSLVRISILTSQDWWDLPSCWKHASPNEGGRRPWGNKCEYCLHTLVHTEAHRQDWVGKNTQSLLESVGTAAADMSITREISAQPMARFVTNVWSQTSQQGVRLQDAGIHWNRTMPWRKRKKSFRQKQQWQHWTTWL